MIRGENAAAYMDAVEEFRFYTPHITRFYGKDEQFVKEYPQVDMERYLSWKEERYV